MKPPELRITGPNSSPYVLGMPLHIHEGPDLLGVVDPLPVYRGGSEVHLEHFVPTHPGDYRERQLSRLVLAEIMTFLVEHFTTVQAISFSLGRDMGDTKSTDHTKRASSRSALLQRMGAGQIVITPKPDAALVGHFVVSGVWVYNPTNLAALASVLQVEREAYLEPASRVPTERKSRLGGLARRLLPRAG